MADDWHEIGRRHNDANLRVMLWTLAVTQGIAFVTYLLAALVR